MANTAADRETGQTGHVLRPGPGNTSARPAEVRRLQALLSRAQAGMAAPLWIVGAAGTGKTYLARIVEADASARGFRTIWVSGYAQPTGEPLLLYDLIQELNVPEQQGASASVVRAARAAIDAACRVGPMLLVFDALDLYLPEEMALVEGLLRRLPTGRVAIVMTMREGAHAGEVRREIDRLAHAAGVERLTLEGLTRAATAEFLEQWFAPQMPSPEFVDSLHEMTGGNPYYLSTVRDHLLGLPSAARRAVVAGLTEPTDDWLPEHVRRNAMAALDGLPDDSVHCLRALAAWSGELPVDALGMLADMTEPELLRALNPLSETGLVSVRRTGPLTVLSIHDPVLERTVDHAVPIGTRRTLHSRCVSLLEAQPTLSPEPERSLARHCMEGSVELTESRAARMMEVARTLAQEGRYQSARGLLEHLLTGVAPHERPDLHAGVVALTGKVYAKLGHRERVGDLLSAAAQLDGPRSSDGRSDIVRALARRMVDSGRDQEAYELGRRELEQSGGLLSPTARAKLESETAASAFQVGLRESGLSLANQAVQRATDAGAHEVEATLLVSLGSMYWRLLEPRTASSVGARAFAAARASASARAVARTNSLIGLAYNDLGAPFRGRRWLTRAYRVAKFSGDRAAESIATRSLAQVDTELGDWERAREWARLAVAVDDSLFRNRHSRRTRAIAAELMARCGDTAARSVLSSHAGEDLAAMPVDVLTAELLAFSAIEEALENDREALRLLDQLDEIIGDHPACRRDLLLEVLPRQALIAERLGRAEVVESAAHRLHEEASHSADVQLLRYGADHAAALAKSARGNWRAAAEIATAAADGLGSLGYRWREGLARLTAGRAHVALQDDDRAAEQLREAYTLFATMGAASELERARAALDGIHRRPPTVRHQSNPGGLTNRELEIATLAANGMTNQQIADRLYISARTVTTHVHHVLAKAGLKSRIQLPEWLAPRA